LVQKFFLSVKLHGLYSSFLILGSAFHNVPALTAHLLKQTDDQSTWSFFNEFYRFNFPCTIRIICCKHIINAGIKRHTFNFIGEVI